jgi:polyhydroxyalkanoate synthesis regulator phasin
MEGSGKDFVEFARQAFQATLDATGKVQQQTQNLLEEMIRQGAVAQEEGKRLLADWLEQSRKHMQEAQTAAAEGYQTWEAEVARRLSAITPATRQEVEALRQQVQDLARRLEALERR